MAFWEAVASAGPYANNMYWTICCSRQIATSTPRHSIFTGRMLFLTPNQQCQNTEGKTNYSQNYDISIPTVSSVISDYTHTHTHTQTDRQTHARTHARTHTHTHTQKPFNSLWSGTTRVSRYQKKHSPTNTHPDHRTSFMIFLHLQRSMASSLFILHA